jgi:hypothetical protein
MKALVEADSEHILGFTALAVGAGAVMASIKLQ